MTDTAGGAAGGHLAALLLGGQRVVAEVEDQLDEAKKAMDPYSGSYASYASEQGTQMSCSQYSGHQATGKYTRISLKCVM